MKKFSMIALTSTLFLAACGATTPVETTPEVMPSSSSEAAVAPSDAMMSSSAPEGMMEKMETK